jgi:hypothetical protein
MTRIDTLMAKRQQHVEAIAALDAQIAAAQDKAAEPKDVRTYVNVWKDAIAIIDNSELPIRDLIERDLVGLAHTSHVKLKDANAITARLLKRIARVRTKAFKAAFRLIRSRIGNKPIMERTLAAWAQIILGEDTKGIDTAIRTGLIAGLDNTEIARKVVGSMGLSGVDGVTEFTRHKIAHLGRAAIRESRQRKEST